MPWGFGGHRSDWVKELCLILPDHTHIDHCFHLPCISDNHGHFWSFLAMYIRQSQVGQFNEDLTFQHWFWPVYNCFGLPLFGFWVDKFRRCSLDHMSWGRLGCLDSCVLSYLGPCQGVQELLSWSCPVSIQVRVVPRHVGMPSAVDLWWLSAGWRFR